MRFPLFLSILALSALAVPFPLAAFDDPALLRIERIEPFPDATQTALWVEVPELREADVLAPESAGLASAEIDALSAEASAAREQADRSRR